MAKDEINQYERVETIAQIFGISVRRVQQLVQDGVISMVRVGKSKRFDVIPTIQQYIKYLSDKAYGRSKSETEAQLKEQKLKAEIALKESQGELHRLKTDIQAGKYLAIEEIKLDYSRFFVAFKKFATSIPNRLAGRLSNFVDPVEVRQIERDLKNEVERLLSSFVMSATEESEISGKAKN